MPFQTTVNAYPGIGLPGDFASANVWTSVPAGPGALVVGAAGLVPGLFAWADPVNRTVSNFGSGAPTGFVHRENLTQAIITTYLAEYSNTIPSGFEVTLMRGGDFFVTVGGTLAAFIGAKAYANVGTGAVSFAATGNPPAAASVTASIAAGPTTSVTGSIAPSAPASGIGNSLGVLTVTAVGSGTLVPGGVIAGTGIQTGTTIIAQLSGTTGGIGTYSVSVPQTVTSTTITETYGTMTVTAVASGAIGVGDPVTGANVSVANTVVTANGTGTGGTGTYIVNNTQTAASATIVANAGVETKWTCEDLCGGGGAVGTIVKMSSQPLG